MSTTPAPKTFLPPPSPSLWRSRVLMITLAALTLLFATATAMLSSQLRKERLAHAEELRKQKSPAPYVVAEPQIVAVPLRHEPPPLRVRENPPPEPPPAPVGQWRDLGNADPITRPTDFVPPAEMDALWKDAIDLVPYFRPDHDVVAGLWAKTNGVLYQGPSQFSRVSFNYLPPEEYDFRIDFTRTGPGSELAQIAPLDGASAAWHMDSWKKCYWGPLRDNPHAITRPCIPNGSRHTSIVEIRKDTLSAWLDGELLLRIAREGAPVNAEQYWRLPDQRVPGIGGKDTTVTFHRVALREVTGKGAPLPKDPFEIVLDEKHWENARDLMPQTIPEGAAMGGQWTLKDGTLHCTGQFARYRLDYAPPKEYDMRIVFSRQVGNRDVLHILSANGAQFTWKMGADQLATLDVLGGKNWWQSPVALRSPDLITNETPHTSIVCVRQNEIRAYVDGRLMLAYKTDFSEMTLEEVWSLNSRDSLGIGSLDNATLFSKIQVKEISGPGRNAAVDKGRAQEAF